MQSIKYQITPICINEHLFEVNIKIPQHQHNALTLSLPAWIPGSYMIRDFSKNLHRLNAHDANNKRVVINQIDKQTWRILSEGKSCSVTYTIYAFDLSVRSAYLSDEYGFFNGTSAFLQIEECEDYACHLIVNKGEFASSCQIATSMPTIQQSSPVPNAEASYFAVASYAELIDHPVLIGNFIKHAFQVRDVLFHMVLTGAPHTDITKICEDLVPICEHHLTLFGDSPCKEYWFITLLSDDGFGGLEHRASTALLFPRFHLPLPNEFDNRSEQYQQFLSLCSHELFHTWHVKKTRPDNMLAPDLSHEVNTEQLWIYEGFTSLYDDLSLVRADLISHARYAQILAENITRLLRTPGRHFQTVAESSFNAWSKFYKQDAGSFNHIVSYYNKGAIISLCLDITLRQLSDNKVTLDHLMKALWDEYGRDEIGTDDDVIQTLCQRKFDLNISAFLDVAVHTVMDLPLNILLGSIGLTIKLRAKESNTDKGGTVGKYSHVVDFGATFKPAETGIVVLAVSSQSAAARSGLQVDDKIIALSNWQVNADSFLKILNGQSLGSQVPLHVLRQGRLLKLKFEIKTAALDTCFIEIADKQMFKNWLGV